MIKFDQNKTLRCLMLRGLPWCPTWSPRALTTRPSACGTPSLEGFHMVVGKSFLFLFIFFFFFILCFFFFFFIVFFFFYFFFFFFFLVQMY
jgi:hypothetical protein